MTTAGASTLPASWANTRRLALVAGGAGAVLSAATALFDLRWFLQAYLVAYLFWLGIALGCLGLLMLHHLVGGAWGFLIRRPLEAAALTIPLLTLLFVPFVLGLKYLYPWAQPERVAHDPALQFKAHHLGYLTTRWFLVRTGVYFALWNGLALLLNRWSRAQDRTEDPGPTDRSQTLSGPGLALTFLAATFASIDWLMSVEPDWYSTMYGPMLIVGMALSAFAATIITTAHLADVEPVAELAKPEPFNDLGNLMLAFVMLWAYMSFSQYLIIWSGNLTEEIPWYLRRSAGGWWYVCVALIVLHFFLPFFCLLSRDLKRDARNLSKIALLILAMHVVNDIWLILPAFKESRAPWVALDLVLAFVGVGGLWIAAYLWLLGGRPLLPRHDPALADVLEHLRHEHGHGHGHQPQHEGGH